MEGADVHFGRARVFVSAVRGCTPPSSVESFRKTEDAGVGARGDFGEGLRGSRSNTT